MKLHLHGTCRYCNGDHQTDPAAESCRDEWFRSQLDRKNLLQQLAHDAQAQAESTAAAPPQPDQDSEL